MLLTRTVSLDIFCNLTFQNGSQLSLLKIAEHIKIDNISITVLLASLVSSASNAQVVACITFRLYNICAEYVCMRSSAYYAPNFEEVEGAYWFGHVRLTVCPSVRLSVTPYVGCKTREPLELGT